MLSTKKVTKNLKEIHIIKDMLQTLFPPAEQAPTWFLMHQSKKQFIDFAAFYDDNAFVGFAYIITNEKLTYILYLAINSNLQSKGYGTKILNYIKEKYADNNIILNIEDMDKTAENYEQRIKRRTFYIKNGYASAGIKMTHRNMTYETLINGNSCTIEECQALFKKFTGPLLSLFVKQKMQYIK